MTDMNTKMCVYQIAHRPSGKKYIGQTTQKLSTRWQQHYTKSHCVKLYSAIKKHGIELFDITILETCETLDQLNEREIHWIKELNTLSPNGYNLIMGGDNRVISDETRERLSNSLKGKKRSPEAREILSIAALKRPPVSAETRQKISIACKGKKRSDKEKIKISERLIGRPVSEETRKKIRDSNIGKLVTAETKLKLCIARQGRIFSDETKLKMSLSHQNISDETRKKLSAAVIGKRHSEESKAKMSLAASNRPPISEETRRRLSESHKNPSDVIRARMREVNLGKTVIHSNEAKRKVSASLILYHSTISPEAKAARIAKSNATRAANRLAKQGCS